jgi:ubiquinone/menaquinone biosynthesis C-methylase UbiE
MDPRRSSIRNGYATVAKAYADHLDGELAAKPFDRAFLDAFAESTGGSGRVVDVGCGPGQVAAYLHQRGIAVEGMDLSPEMIEQATARHPQISFRVGDMFALPYADAALAGVAAFYAIVHMPTAELTLPFRELHRVVAPGGVVALAFHVGTDQVHVDDLFGCSTSLDFWFHPPDVVSAMLVEAGFVIEARLDREPHPGAEHPSRRSYLRARRGIGS